MNSTTMEGGGGNRIEDIDKGKDLALEKRDHTQEQAAMTAGN